MYLYFFFLNKNVPITIFSHSALTASWFGNVTGVLDILQSQLGASTYATYLIILFSTGGVNQVMTRFSLIFSTTTPPCIKMEGVLFKGNSAAVVWESGYYTFSYSHRISRGPGSTKIPL